MIKSKGIFYGWWILIAVFLMFVCASSSPFPVILKNLIVEFNTDRGSVSFIPAIFAVSMAASAYLYSRVLEKHNIKKFVLTGGIISGVCLLLCTLVNALWQLYALFFIMGLGSGICGAVPMSVMISRWFVRKRGMVMGIAWAGFPIGGMIVAPINGLIASTYDWRATFIFSGLLFLVISIPMALFVFKESPKTLGLLPDGDTVDTAKIITEPAKIMLENKTGLGNYLKHLPIYLISISFFLILLGEMAIIQHEVSFLTDMGFTQVFAASLLGITSALSGFGRFVFGWIADRISPRYILMILLAVEIIGVAILLQADGLLQVWLFVIIWGIASGVAFVFLPLVVQDIYGAAAFTIVYGFISSLTTLAQAGGGPLAGFIFDATGSYHSLFYLTIAFYVVAIISIYFAYGCKPGRFFNTGAETGRSKV